MIASRESTLLGGHIFCEYAPTPDSPPNYAWQTFEAYERNGTSGSDTLVGMGFRPPVLTKDISPDFYTLKSRDMPASKCLCRNHFLIGQETLKGINHET